MRKQLTIIILILVGAAVGGFYYFTQQVTEVPKWYQVQRLVNKELNKSSLNNTTSFSRKMLKFERGQAVNVQLSSSEINDLIQLILLRELGNQEPLGLPEGIQARIENNELEVGGIVNLGELAQSDIQPRYRAIVEKIVARFPQFANRNLYLGIQGNPLINEGKIALSKDSLIRIGNLTFTTADLSKISGFSEERVSNMLRVRLRNISIKDISIQEDKLNLRISKK